MPEPAPTPPPQTPTVWTIKALVDWTTDFLAKKGIEGPRAEAQILLAHVLKCKKVDLLVRYDEQPSEAERNRFKELIHRRVAGKSGLRPPALPAPGHGGRRTAGWLAHAVLHARPGCLPACSRSGSDRDDGRAQRDRHG